MKALIVIYALGIIGMVGAALGYDRDAARKRIVVVVLRSLAWPVIVPVMFVFTAGQMIGKWAGGNK